MIRVCGYDPHKADAQRLLEQLVTAGERLVTDAEVLQGIMHRYTAIERREAIEPAFAALLGVVDAVLPIDASTAQRAKQLLLAHSRVSARDAIHAAIMQQHRIASILSFDRDYDLLPGIDRLPR